MKTIQTFSPFLNAAASHGGISRKWQDKDITCNMMSEHTNHSQPTPRVKRWNYTHCHNLWNQQQSFNKRSARFIMSTRINNIHPSGERFFWGNRSEEQEDIALSTLFLLKGTWTNWFCCCTDTKISAGWCTCENGKWNLPLKGIFSYSGCAINAPHSYLFQRGDI